MSLNTVVLPNVFYALSTKKTFTFYSGDSSNGLYKSQEPGAPKSRRYQLKPETPQSIRNEEASWV